MSAAERLVALFVAPVPVAPPDVASDAAPGPGGGERPANAAAKLTPARPPPRTQTRAPDVIGRRADPAIGPDAGATEAGTAAVRGSAR